MIYIKTRNLLVVVLLIVSTNIIAQQKKYAVSSYLTEGAKAPNTHYIGEAWLNGLLTADGDID